MTNNLTIEDRLSVAERTLEEIRIVVNSLSNEKVPRITMRRLNKALGNGSYASTQTSEEIDDEEISDVEAAIFDAKKFAEIANQDTRRAKSILEVHSFILIEILSILKSEVASNIINTVEEYVTSPPSNKEILQHGILRSGLEQRARMEELEMFRQYLGIRTPFS